MSKGLCAPDSQGKGETEGLHVEKGHERILISPGWERTRPGQRDLLWAGERWLSKDSIFLPCMQCRGIGPHLVARGKSHGFSRVGQAPGVYS